MLEQTGNALELRRDGIAAGGDFSTPGNNIAYYDFITTTWSELGDGLDDICRAMVSVATDLYVTGDFHPCHSGVANWHRSFICSLVINLFDGACECLSIKRCPHGVCWYRQIRPLPCGRGAFKRGIG